MPIHHPASTVLSPKDCVNSVAPIYDGGPIQGEYSVAIIDWQGRECIGIRWNINERELDSQDKVSGKVTCMGEPNSRGYPTWFIIPDAFLTALSHRGNNISEKIKEYLEKNK